MWLDWVYICSSIEKYKLMLVLLLLYQHSKHYTRNSLKPSTTTTITDYSYLYCHLCWLVVQHIKHYFTSPFSSTHPPVCVDCELECFVWIHTSSFFLLTKALIPRTTKLMLTHSWRAARIIDVMSIPVNICWETKTKTEKDYIVINSLT